VRQNQARGISVQIAAKIARERERVRYAASATSSTCHCVRQNQARGISVQIAAKINRENERLLHAAIATSSICQCVRQNQARGISVQIAAKIACPLGFQSDFEPNVCES